MKNIGKHWQLYSKIDTMEQFCVHDVCSQRFQGENINLVVLGHRSLPGNLFKAVPLEFIDTFEENHMKVQNFGHQVQDENATIPTPTELCVVQLKNGQWYRVEVINNQSDTSLVYCIDYGVLSDVPKTAIRVSRNIVFNQFSSQVISNNSSFSKSNSKSSSKSSSKSPSISL